MKRNLIVIGAVLCLLGLAAFGGLLATRGFAQIRGDRPLQIALIATVGVGYILIRIGAARGEQS